jgi:protein required for attachment to host cells
MERICIVLADAARARLYTFEEREESPGQQVQALEERVDLVNPERRRRPSELFSEPRPGSDRAPSGRGFATDDHREAHMRELDRRFACSIVDETARLAHGHGATRVIVAASPHLLGELRLAAGPLRRAHLHLDELDRDLTSFSPSQMHDYLADCGLMPARPRIADQPWP